jgi:hypothetical protein
MTDEEHDSELMRLSAELEALLAAWIEIKRRSEERIEAIKAAVRKATGVSDKDAAKYKAQAWGTAFGRRVSPEVKRYDAICSQIESQFPEIEDSEWERVTAPLGIVVDQILSIRPETFAELGIHARAIQYLWVDPEFTGNDEDYNMLRQFLADTMRLSGLPGPMVASSNLDAGVVAFVKNWGDKLQDKIDKDWRTWERNGRELADEARLEANGGPSTQVPEQPSSANGQPP